MEKVIRSWDQTVVASYSYDAWGNPIDWSGPMTEINPIRYRGYYYDTETGLYYVSSRYYDPEICRFINADDASNLGANSDFANTNLFAYCGDNPVNREDDGGEFWHVVGSALLGGVLSAGFEIAAQLKSGKSIDSLDWTSICIDAVSGALIGAAVSIGLSSGAVTASKALISAGTSIAHGIHERKDPRIIIINAGLSAFGSLAADKATSTIGKHIQIGKHERISRLKSVTYDLFNTTDNEFYEVVKALTPGGIRKCWVA